VWTGAAQGAVKDYAAYSRDYVVRIEGKPDLVGSSDRSFAAILNGTIPRTGWSPLCPPATC
jgi:hypothetical protein